MSALDPLRNVRVRSWKVGWGEVRTDGTLGYDGGCCPSPRCRLDLSDALLISAHAPSRLEIDTDEPVELFGFLNASARFNPNNAVEFWADWNFVGELTVPGAGTPSQRLEPGRHVLVVTCADPTSRHTLWAVRKASVGVASPLTVLTIAAYPEERVPSEIGIMARSARRAEVPLKVCFVGERYASHAEMKIRRLLPIVRELETPRVAYVDARDCVFVAGIERIEEEFAAMRTRIVVSAEAQCWPVRDDAWIARFPSHSSGCNWLNAGQWLGERSAIMDALTLLAGLPRRALRERSSDALAMCRRLPEDDQLLWQAAWLGGELELELDYDGRIFRNVNTLDTSLVDNRDFDLSDGAVFRPSGRRASVLHFSGAAAEHCMHQWGGLLGAL